MPKMLLEILFQENHINPEENIIISEKYRNNKEFR